MGCNTSKLDDEEAVQLCKDRKRFIKQAVEQRMRFASGHIAYIQALRRVSAALRDYVEGDEPREFLLDSFITPPVMSIKKSTPKFITISPKCFSAPPNIESQGQGQSTVKICYYKSGANPSYSVEETPRSPETTTTTTLPIQSFSSGNGMDGFGFGFGLGFFPMQDTSGYSYYSPDSRPNNNNNIPPPSPQASQWDFFWNPFSSLDYYGYPMRSGPDQFMMDEDIAGLRQVREEEGIPDLEDETEHEEIDTRSQSHSHSHSHRTGQPVRNVYNHARDQGTEHGQGGGNARTHSEEQQRARNIIPIYANAMHREEVTVEDVDEDDEEDNDDDDDDDDEADSEDECQQHQVNGGLQQPPHAAASAGERRAELSQAGQVEVCHQETTVSKQDTKEEAPGFTAFVKKRPISMDEVIKDLEEQFIIICSSASEVSALLAASKTQQHSSAPNELSAMKMLNPVALFRSASSRSSSSSRFFRNSSNSRYGSSESSSSNSDICEESCNLSGSHQSTVGKLCAWEKRLYEEVRSGERIRLAYEKKCMQLRSQDVKGDDPCALDKTRAAIRDLHTQIKVSIRSIEAVSKRIEALRDEELQPQLLELLLGLARMWKIMAECHQTQKYTLDEAKYLLAGTPSKLNNKAKQQPAVSAAEHPRRLARSAANLETELRNWRSCFESWITSQRSYVHALTGWLLRCMRCEPADTSKLLPFSEAPPIFGICIQWSRFLDRISEMSPVLDGLDFFAAGMGSVYAQQVREDSRRAQQKSTGPVPVSCSSSSSDHHQPPIGNMEVVEFRLQATEEEEEEDEEEEGEEIMTPEKMAEVAVRVLCAGMSVAMSSLMEFAISSAEGYAELVSQWETAARRPPPPASEAVEENAM
ncbi:hypothetical protein Dimus_025695 [Dionaea muscipula]